MNCGCGELDKRHKESDIVREDIQRAADGRGSSLEETRRNMETSFRQMDGRPGVTAGQQGQSSTSAR
jgi:hypothetical protein